jgi:hypothetical protein
MGKEGYSEAYTSTEAAAQNLFCLTLDAKRGETYI